MIGTAFGLFAGAHRRAKVEKVRKAAEAFWPDIGKSTDVRLGSKAGVRHLPWT
jgi:hypothetical protein